MAARRLNPFLLVIAAIVVLGIVAIVVTSGDDDDGAASGLEQTHPVSIEGEALVELESGADDPAVGTAAPRVSGSSFDGTPVTIGDRAMVVVFVAHWCPHCQAEVPRIVEWLRENGPPEGAELLAVSTSVDASAPNHPPSAWLEREGFDVPTLADDADSSAAQAYGLTGFPYFVAVDADGRVVARESGGIGTDALEALLDAARGA